MAVNDSFRSYVLDQLSRVTTGVRFFSILGGIGYFGILGMFIGPQVFIVISL